MLTTKDLMLMKPDERMKAIFLEKLKCYKNYKYMIETYFSVDSQGKRIPFKLMKHQKKALKAYLAFQNNITMKTRQMGFTTFTAAFIAAEMINKNNFKTLIISKEMISARDFVKTIKDVLDNARKITRMTDSEDSESWLVPKYLEGYNNKESFTLENQSFVRAQGNTEDAGRGFSGLNLVVVDEVAFIDRKSPERMKEIWAAVGPALSTVRGRSIMISTPRGSSGWYYDTYTNAKNMGFNIIDAHWTEHPLFNQGQYQWIKDDSHQDGGYIKFYNDVWPDALFDKETGMYVSVSRSGYSFICDGKIRSPWYDAESKKLGPVKTACELDCSFVGTGGEVFEQDILRAMKAYASSSPFSTPLTRGLLNQYKEYHAPIPGRKYVLASDVATGDGSDYSTIVVLDLLTLQICAIWKGQCLPETLASFIKEIGMRYNGCPAVVENAGGGGSTLQELKEAKYYNIYYTTLKKKDESLGTPKRKIGLWVSEDTRAKGGDKLETYIRTGLLNINSTDLVDEFYNWIWDKDQKRRHAPGKNDDLIIALQWAVYYHAYVFKRNMRNRENFQRNFAVQKNGVAYESDTVGGMMAYDGANYSPGEIKRNNGIDIIDQKTRLIRNDKPDDKLGGRRTVQFL